MSEADDDREMEEMEPSHDDLLDVEPTKQEKIEMRKASKSPSEWLRLLCRQWAEENELLVETTDAKFIDFKPYLKGMLTSQLLCRLSIPSIKDPLDGGSVQPFDFWEILGIEDSFDRAYIVSQVERFCAIYSIRALSIDDDSLPLFSGDLSGADPHALAAAAANIAEGNAGLSYLDSNTTAVVAALPPDSKVLRHDTKLKEQKRLSIEKKEQKARDREAMALRKANERAMREASREERRRKKIEIRQQREKFAAEQKEAALRRAAELVCSNRVPIEITRGAKAVMPLPPPPVPAKVATEDEVTKKNRSAIVVSTAADLDQIVTHSKNLWAKYNAIAKEHNQKVNWTTVAKELGIHVKVREKYARMHFRAEQRGFDWVKYGDWKIKDHPEIFLEPTQAEQKAKMPLPPPDASTTVLISDTNREISFTNGDHSTKDAHSEALATAAAVVDATMSEDQIVASTLVVDPTGYASDTSGDKHNTVCI
ncbi:hypothetical protein FisN_14Lh005 [Fistulifera solaris]|uniref:Uncharacterized protein n=1 Tax=Fistulifera solaris TaxID=1519565 RepID=A0A1Z5KIC0_FISSO|nr:hypothetical protein FisN_14Lh005 [Fistulifera solaris]|eukprot:GAX25698.1 hypothetical protein FisN_14Lh005 [Fistulifera solaris]